MSSSETLNTASADLERILADAGVPPRIAAGVAAAGPHADLAAMCAASDRVVRSLSDAELRDVIEVMPAPPVLHADAGTRDAARLALEMYHKRYGYPYVSHIETPTAEELLMRVRIRLGNELLPEWRAAREHIRRLSRARITRALRDTGPAPP